MDVPVLLRGPVFDFMDNAGLTDISPGVLSAYILCTEWQGGVRRKWMSGRARGLGDLLHHSTASSRARIR